MSLAPVADLSTAPAASAPAVTLRHAAGARLDLLVFDAGGRVFDRAAGSFGPWADARLADYVIPGVEQRAGGVYRFALPPCLSPQPAVLCGLVTERAVADPATTDASVAAVAPEVFDQLRPRVGGATATPSFRSTHA